MSYLRIDQSFLHGRLTSPLFLLPAVYLNSPAHVELEVGTGAAVALDSTGWEDTVVWNPHLTMKDCYQHFCCVENAK